MSVGDAEWFVFLSGPFPFVFFAFLCCDHIVTAHLPISVRTIGRKLNGVGPIFCQPHQIGVLVIQPVNVGAHFLTYQAVEASTLLVAL